MPYKVAIKKSAKKEMRKIPKEYYNAIVKRIFSLADNPRPFGCLKLSGVDDKYRIRVGVYRIIYIIKDDILMVNVIIVDHQSSVYEALIVLI